MRLIYLIFILYGSVCVYATKECEVWFKQAKIKKDKDSPIQLFSATPKEKLN